MALPTVTKSWQFAVNQSFADGTLATVRPMVRAIKNQLIGAGGLTWTNATGTTTTPVGGWTVVSSSNGATSGASDLWATDADLVWNTAGSAHSWIVLQQTGISATFQLLIALDSTGSSVISMQVSHTAFSGGTTTANPTSANSNTLFSQAEWGAGASTTTTRLHVLRTTDGSGTRVIFHRGGHLVGCIILDAMGNIPAGVPVNYVAFGVGTGTTGPSSPTPTSADFAGTIALWKGFGTAALASYGASLGWGNGSAATQLGGASTFTGEAPLLGVEIMCPTAGQRGPLGVLVDSWFGLSQNPNISTHPDTGTLKQFCQHGLLVTPWNRSTPLAS